MKRFSYILILVIGAALCFEIISGFKNIELQTKSVFLKSNGYNSQDECTARFSCLNCTTARVCAPKINGSFVELRRFNCSSSSPYCDPNTGTCTSNMAAQCTQAQEDNFICLSNGYFPDPLSCTLFHYCENYVSNAFQCLTNYYYNSIVKACTLNSGCYNFYCSGKNGQKVTYSRDSSIYAYCVANLPLVLDRCLGSDTLNLTSQECEPICVQEGLIEDTEDCLSYYECKLSSKYPYNIYSKTHKTCPIGEAFEPSAYQCVPSSQTSCQFKSTPETVPPESTLPTTTQTPIPTSI